MVVDSMVWWFVLEVLCVSVNTLTFTTFNCVLRVCLCVLCVSVVFHCVVVVGVCHCVCHFMEHCVHACVPVCV